MILPLIICKNLSRLLKFCRQSYIKNYVQLYRILFYFLFLIDANCMPAVSLIKFDRSSSYLISWIRLSGSESDGQRPQIIKSPTRMSAQWDRPQPRRRRGNGDDATRRPVLLAEQLAQAPTRWPTTLLLLHHGRRLLLSPRATTALTAVA